MLRKSEYKSVEYRNSTVGKGGFTFTRLGVASIAFLYLVSVLTLVLVAKMALATPVDATLATSTAQASFLADNSGRIIAIVIGLGVALGFFANSKREAHKLLR